jgi:hypothetical protein
VVGLPPALLATLDKSGITTLRDILAAGGVRRIESLPTDDPALNGLEAHANLSILPSNVQTNARLLERGYTNSVAIARRTRTEFLTSVAGALPDAQAEQVHRAAQAQTALLSNVLAGERADGANGYATLTGLTRPCECKDCQAAISPLAYLADLLDYASQHLRRSLSHLISGSRPAVCSWGSDRLDLFVLGKDYALWHARYDGSWSTWASLGGSLASYPAAASWGPNRIDIVAFFSDRTVQHTWFDGTWHPWEALDNILSTNPEVRIDYDRNPAMCSWGQGHLDVFVGGSDGGLWWRRWSGNAWSGWEQLTSRGYRDPGAASWETNRTDVFVEGIDPHLPNAQPALFQEWIDGTWHESMVPTVLLAGHPTVRSWGPGRLDIFMWEESRQLQHLWYDRDWHGWEPVLDEREIITSSLAAVSSGAGRIDLLAWGPDGTLYQKSYENQWNPWRSPRSLEGRIDIAFLTSCFHQPFGDLPVGCEVVDIQVHQVRLCVEVLRRYLAASGSLMSQARRTALVAAEAAYALEAYRTLLVRIGTSYDEIRLIRSATADESHALAERLGIDPPEDGDNHLNELFLAPEAIAEARLEALFGLVATRRGPLSEGSKQDDPREQMRRWNLKGVWWNRNTDADGAVYLRLREVTGPTGLEYHVEIYRDRDRTQQVALGTSRDRRGTVELHDVEDSGLSGSVELNYAAESAEIAITLIPRLLSWRLAHLRTLWRAQDWPSDPHAEGDLPAIDPDVVTPDDFRDPVAKANASAPNQPFDLWIIRREWVDGRLAVFATMSKHVRGQEVPDLEAMLQEMYQPVTYGGTSLPAWKQPPLAELKMLLEALRGADRDAAKTAADRIQKDLRLSVEAFTRLMDIRDKATRWETDRSDDAVTDAEWMDVYSILTQAQKSAFFTQWVKQERQWEGDPANGKLLFSPQHFWPSLREPREGEWSATLPGPRLDPEMVMLTDLWEPAVRDAALQPKTLDRALSLWQGRQQELTGIRDALQHAFETTDFDAMLRRALGHPNAGDDLPYKLADLKNDLDSGDEREVKQATSDIENGLYMSVQDFNRLMLVWLKVDKHRKTTKAEMDAVYAILTTAEKRKRRYGTWRNEENDASSGVRYWQALKARLPRWRASSEARQAWRQALAARSQRPIVDPDVIGPGHLRNPFGDVYRLWRSRAGNIEDQILSLGRNPQTLAGLDTLLASIVGIGEETLGKLAERRDRGEGMAAQLAQLNLPTDAFVYLAGIRKLLATDQPVLPGEWESVYAILTQVWKQRQFADWRAQEQKVDILLSQDLFQIPTIEVTIFPPPPPPEPPKWRASWRARRDWEDTVRSRIEQEGAVREDLRQAVLETEADVLPRLRDALVLATDAPGQDLAGKARWVTRRLLIDAQMDGRQMTTRVAQAIETLLNLLWSARLGQLDEIGVALTLDAPNFDEEWRWIGSYATWRAAMFVFMYPDNLLLPSLRRQQTPAFRDLVTALRSGRRLTPVRARQIAAGYERYWGDVGLLKAVASCYARVGKDLQPHYFLFGVGGVTNLL